MCLGQAKLKQHQRESYDENLALTLPRPQHESISPGSACDPAIQLHDDQYVVTDMYR